MKDLQYSSLTFPYDFSDVLQNLNLIEKNDYSFKYKIERLRNIPNSAIAEYFVNLYFSFKFKIEPKDFKKYSNTQVDNELYPVFTAPGGVPDMCYFDKEKVINIETTIHRTKNEIEKNEIFPCINHLCENAKKENDYNRINRIIFVYKKLKKIEENQELKRKFEKVFFTLTEFIPKKEIEIFNFSELKNTPTN